MNELWAIYKTNRITCKDQPNFFFYPKIVWTTVIKINIHTDMCLITHFRISFNISGLLDGRDKTKSNR